MDVKVTMLLLSDIFRVCVGVWELEWFPGQGILTPLFPFLLRSPSALLKE